MNIVFQPINGDQHGHLEIIIDKSDHGPAYKAELKKLSKTAHIKGFRQGAVPPTVLEKMYGTSLKADVLNKLVDEYVNDYQKKNDVHFLGDLIPASDLISEQDLDQDQIKFIFEVGLLPKLNIQDAIDQTKVTKYKIQITDEIIKDEWERMLDRSKESVEVQEPIIANDLVEISMQEMQDGEIIEDGHQSKFVILCDDSLTDEMKEKLLGKNVGDSLLIDTHKIEKDASEADIRQYFLNLSKEDAKVVGNEFSGQIIKVSRKKEVELNDAFFVRVFGPDSEVKDVEKAKSFIEEQIKNYFDTESEKLLDIEISQELVKALHADYPEKFMIKWLQRTYKEWAEQSGHELEHNLYHFKENLSWKAISDYVVTSNNVKINTEDFIKTIIDDLKREYGGINLPEETWRSFALRSLENKEKASYYQEIYVRQQVLHQLKQKLEISQGELSMDDFKARVKHLTSHDHHH